MIASAIASDAFVGYCDRELGPNFIQNAESRRFFCTPAGIQLPGQLSHSGWRRALVTAASVRCDRAGEVHLRGPPPRARGWRAPGRSRRGRPVGASRRGGADDEEAIAASSRGAPRLRRRSRALTPRVTGATRRWRRVSATRDARTGRLPAGTTPTRSSWRTTARRTSVFSTSPRARRCRGRWSAPDEADWARQGVPRHAGERAD